MSDPGDDAAITLTCVDEAHDDDRCPYSPNLDGTAEIWCPHCSIWLHHRCCTSVGIGKDRWVEGAPLVGNLKRAPILRGKWYAGTEREDWMLAGCGKRVTEFRALNLPDSTSDEDAKMAFGNDGLADDFPDLDCEYFRCPRCQNNI